MLKGWRQRKAEKGQRISENMIRARQRNIEEGPAPEYPAVVNPREYWTEIEIIQHSPFGIKKSKIIAFMSHDRVDTSIVKADKLFLFRDKGEGLLRLGNHRLMAWIAKNILTRYGRFE